MKRQRRKIMKNLVEESACPPLILQSIERLQAKYLEEAPLYFRSGAMDVDPKRGLTLHGPVDAGDDVQTIRIGVVSDSKGIQDVTSCLEYLNSNPVRNRGDQPFTTLTFPGFAKAFHSRLIFSKRFNEKLLSAEISHLIGIDNPNLRIKRAAEIYGKKVGNICEGVVVPDVIICHKPEVIEKNCNERRVHGLRKKEREKAEEIRKNVETHKILAPLDEDTKSFIEMTIRADFRRALKATSVKSEGGVPIQILKQSTLEALNYAIRIPTIPGLKHSKEDSSTIAWNLAVALYYKANHFPWRVGNLSSGSCYVGISFYYDRTTHERNMFASLAQIFIDTGEGMVVRGDAFHWDTKKRGEPHLTKESAQGLLEKALDLYKKHHNDQPPNRVVIHKTSKYTGDEVQGFLNGSDKIPRYDYVTLSKGRGVFFYRNGEHPVLRGTFLQMLGDSCLLYTCGYVHYLKSYFGPRVPRPLEMSEHHGDTPPEELATETIALTRLDWNTTRYSLYNPITLGLAEKVKAILGSIKQGEKIQHQYRFYM
jgi:hypothetical protein